MLISTNPPLIPGIWSLAPTSTMARLRLQRAASESSRPTKTITEGKLDGVGPVDNRPSTDKLHHFVRKKEEEKKKKKM